MNKYVKWGLILIGVGILTVGGIGLYMFNQPHRNVQATKTDFTMSSTDLVQEYLQNADAANDKYLGEEGDSKIFAITGTVASIDEDMNHQKVILLKDDGQDAGVSCTFTESTNANAIELKIGDTTTIKGVIRSGAGYDEDLELYEDVIMEKCDVVTK